MTWIWINCSYWSKTQRHIKKQSDWSSRQVLNLAITPNFNVGCLPINQKFRNFQDGVKWCGTFPENRKTGSTLSISKEDPGFWNSLWQMKKHFRQFFKKEVFLQFLQPVLGCISVIRSVYEFLCFRICCFSLLPHLNLQLGIFPFVDLLPISRFSVILGQVFVSFKESVSSPLLVLNSFFQVWSALLSGSKGWPDFSFKRTVNLAGC